MAAYGEEPRVPSIPDPRFSSQEDVLQALKEWVEVRQGARGEGIDRAVTMRDLLNAGLATPESINSILTPDNALTVPPGNPEPAVPPTPTNLSATGGVTTIILTVDFARGYSRLSHFEWWRSETDNLSEAVAIAQTTATMYADVVGEGFEYYYWVRAVSDGGVSPFNAVAGVLGQTSLNYQQVQDAIDATIDSSAIWDQLTIKTDENGNAVGWGPASTPPDDVGNASLFAVLAPRFIVAPPPGYGLSSSPMFTVQTVPGQVNGVEVPVGVYMSNAYIMNGAITNAKIGQLAVDDAKIASVSASKLTAGQIAVGEYIESTGFQSGQSGFRVNGAGNAEFNNVTTRGTVYASAGSVGGILIDSTGIKSSNYNETTAGFRVGADGNVVFNNGTFRGALDAATGTFKGSLSAATGSFKGALDAATGTFNGGVMGGAFTGYAWPPSGQYGFYLGPNGLLLGNANNNRYVQITSTGDFYAPGMSIVAGSMTISAVNVVGTLQIQGEAVTVPRGAYLTNFYGNTYEGSWVNLLSVFMPAGINNIFIQLGAHCARGTAMQKSFTFELLRNGSVIWSRSVYSVNGEYAINVGLVHSYTLAATYTLRVLGYYANGTGWLDDVYLTAIGCKR